MHTVAGYWRARIKTPVRHRDTGMRRAVVGRMSACSADPRGEAPGPGGMEFGGGAFGR